MDFGGFAMTPGRGRACAPKAPLIAVAALLAALAASPARAQDASPDSPFRALMKGAGLATDVAPPPDFVQQSRSPQEPDSIPAFTTPAEPPGKIKTAKELEEMDGDLQAVAKRHDALRAAFPPSAKAMAEAAAAKKAKSRDKPAKSGPIPTF
jgi:hypothetical protein